MIINKYLIMWLPFDTSRDEDKAGNASVSWYAGGTLNSSIVFHGANSNYFSSESMYPMAPINLGGQDFTVDFWVNPKEVSSITATDIRGIFSISEIFSSSIKTLLQISNSPKTGKFYFYYSSDGTCDSTKLVEAELTLTALSQWVHVAIVYKDSNSTITVYLNGQSQTVCQLSAPITRQGVYPILGKGVKESSTGYTDSYGTCYIDEFTLYDDKALYSSNFTPPTTSFYDEPYTVVVKADTSRKIVGKWRYENPGRADLLTTANGTTVTNLTPEQSVTGVAFYQPDKTACFGIFPEKEIWIKCDIYTTANYSNNDRIRIYSDDSSNANGFSTDPTITNRYAIWHNGTSKTGGYSLGANKRRPFWMHMVSDANDGLIDCLIGNEEFSYIGNVNNGNDFSNLYIQMDGSNIYVSNLIISNEPLEFYEGYVLNFYDTERILTGSAETFIYDLMRRIVRTEGLDADCSRVLVKTVTPKSDLERDIIKTFEFSCDTCRQIPHSVSNNDSTLQSVSISLQEQQLTDNVTFTHIGNADIMSAVNMQFLDYVTDGRVEETSTRGVLQTCKCTCDIDEILYKQMAYEVSESDWEWTPEYEDAVDEYNATHEDTVEKVPSAPASAHITSIANSLGKNISLKFDDYISTMDVKVQSGTNYAGLISELFGWTSRLPQRMINCYMRGDTIYVIQRGHEDHVVVLDNQELTVHTVTKKIIRTTWGSDPKTETEVKPVYDTWASPELTPFPPQSQEPSPEGGDILGDDGLVQRTTVEHGDERVETTYEYEELDGGKKYLYRETAVTYVNGVQTDEVVTTHDRVSYGQSQITATDDSGILGSVVSPSDFDDRVTPYQYQGMMSGNGSYKEGFVGGYDSNGHFYPYVWDADGQRYLQTGYSSHEKKLGEYTRTINGVALIDTSFPVDGDALLQELTNDIRWLDRKTEESVTLELYDYNHVIDFNDRISWHGNIYYLRSNTVSITENIRNKQTLEFVRWY